MRLPPLVLGLSLLAPSTAFATWSVIAVDLSTGRVVIASATCVNRDDQFLKGVQAVVVPGKGVAACQAAVDGTHANQMLVFAELQKGTDPKRIIELLAQDPAFQSRQFGILDLQGRSTGFSGSGNQPTALSEAGKVGTTIHYQMQGNILASDAVIHDAAAAFRRTTGKLSDRVMAAMEAADARGGDKRCTDGRTAFVAYILVVDKTGKETYITATDEESSNPITTLRAKYGKSGL